MPNEPESRTTRAEGEPLSLDERKFQLELQKFELEKSKSRGTSFFNSNLGIILTAMVGIATVAVSYLQLQISNQSSLAQLELEKSTAKAARDKDERAFQFDVARMLLEKQSDISTEDLNHVYYLRDIVMSTLPADISVRITRKMAENASRDDLRSAWNDGYVKLQLSVTTPSAGPAQPATTVDFVVTQLPILANPDGKGRIADILQAAGEFKLEDSNTVEIMLAFILSNTNYLKLNVENLNYHSAARLTAIWPRLFPTADDARPFVGNPELLANKIYADRMGNVESGDGWKYRGRGYLMTTGRASYERSSALVGVDLVANPDQLLDSKIAAREVAATFAQLGKPISVESVVRGLNGGFMGLAEVQAIFEKLAAGTPRVTEGLTITSGATNGDAVQAQ